ncbi:MAG: MurR/RpiR family transcriptional regulator [Clostridiaceae bacterium]|jgi:RpiR family carbohydrate utilization transcriptional regulator|nr:MurR/RpiR family transcriptional regulator [Clostridiaceae bacterium]
MLYGLKGNGKSCVTRIKMAKNDFTDAYKKIAEQILAVPETVVHMTIVQMAELCETSEASIVRFCKQIGYEGFNDMKINLAGEISIGNQSIQENVVEGDDDETILQKVFSSEIQALMSTRDMINTKAFRRAVDSIIAANKVEFYAYGNSCPLASDAHYRMLKIGINSYMGVDILDSLMHANMMTPMDVAIGISHSGSTKHTCAAMETAKNHGAVTICVTSYDKSPIAQISDICLLASSNETTIFRTVAMESRMAQMAILDALYVAVAFRRLEKSKRFIHLTDKLLSEEKY